MMTNRSDMPQGKDRTENGDTRDGFSGTVDVLKHKATDAFDASKDYAADAAQRTVAGIDANPLGLLVGGIALGVVAGALIPRSGKEKELLAPLGSKLYQRAVAAMAAAKEAGQGELDQLGLNRANAQSQVRSLVDGLIQSATVAGNAAANARGNAPDASEASSATADR